MFVGKILIGVWEEETIILKGMPKDFVLSARSLVVLERDEYEQLKAENEQRKKDLAIFGDHLPSCAYVQGLKGCSIEDCDCGFYQTLKEK